MESSTRNEQIEFSRTPLRRRTSSLYRFRAINGKISLVNPSEEHITMWMEKLNDFIEDGGGDTIFEVGAGENLGMEDPGLKMDELNRAVENFAMISEKLGARCTRLNVRRSMRGYVSDCLVRRVFPSDDFLEVRIIVVGNVDVGKSTLLGVLTHDELDDGKGASREKLFRYKHELQSGRTSSVGNEILGFDENGKVMNESFQGSLDWLSICQRSSKVVNFIDLAGHERYLKTTIFGMTAHAPDFAMLVVGANSGIVGMTKEHLGLLLTVSIPLFVVVTKIDICPGNVKEDNLCMLNRLLRSSGCRRIPLFMKKQDDVIFGAKTVGAGRICPIFLVSSVTGESMDLLRMFLNLLIPKLRYRKDLLPEFMVDDVFPKVPGTGVVMSGTLIKGIVNVDDTLLVGPNSHGQFLPFKIKSIQRKKLPVSVVQAGQSASFALKKTPKEEEFRKGMIFISPQVNPVATMEFEADITILHHPTTIYPRYQAMVHCENVRQTAFILKMNTKLLRTGDSGTVHCRFIKLPEYLRVGSDVIFRESRSKAIGIIKRIFSPEEEIGEVVYVKKSRNPPAPHLKAGTSGEVENDNIDWTLKESDVERWRIALNNAEELITPFEMGIMNWEDDGSSELSSPMEPEAPKKTSKPKKQKTPKKPNLPKEPSKSTETDSEKAQSSKQKNNKGNDSKLHEKVVSSKETTAAEEDTSDH